MVGAVGIEPTLNFRSLLKRQLDKPFSHTPIKIYLASGNPNITLTRSVLNRPLKIWGTLRIPTSPLRLGAVCYYYNISPIENWHTESKSN